MTEESFQQCRKVMQSANHIRWCITKAKKDVKKWTSLEDAHRRNLKHDQADGCKKVLDKAIERLNNYRLKFAQLKLPESDIVIHQKPSKQCAGCGARIAEGNDYCGECLCEEDGI